MLETARPGWLKCRNLNCLNDRGFVEDPARGDVICTACGLVLFEKNISSEAEWRNFDDDKDSSRAEKVDDFGQLGTTISSSKYNESANAEKSKSVISHRHGVKDSHQRNMEFAISKINEIGNTLHLPSIILDSAKAIYNKYETNKKTKRGSKQDPFFTAVIYLACKENNFPRTFRELERLTGHKMKDISKHYKALEKVLPSKKTSAVVAPSDLTNRFCSLLNLPFTVQNAAMHIAKLAAPKLEGKTPNSIAAASIYMATLVMNQKCNEKDIEKVSSIKVSTIKSIHKEMQAWANEILPENVKSS